jgi:hypothetical protein
MNTYDVSTPTFSTKCETPIGFGAVGYNIPAGTISISGYTIGPIGAHLVDSFIFHGLPPGNPVTFGLRVHYEVSISSVITQGHLSLAPFDDDPGDVPQSIAFVPGHSAGNLVMTLTRPAETLVGLEIDASFAVSGLDSGRGAFVFDFVLPPGVSVTSCNGYVQDAPVPALSTSWGGLKAAYR